MKTNFYKIYKFTKRFLQKSQVDSLFVVILQILAVFRAATWQKNLSYSVIFGLIDSFSSGQPPIRSE
jgi:hypothetical protein